MSTTPDTEESTTTRARIWIGAIGAPAAFLALWIAPLPISAPAHHLAAIFGAVLLLWITEVIPIAATALLIAPLLVVFEVATPKDAFKHYADPLLFLFVGGFFMAEAMRRHGLDVRVARVILDLRWVRAIPSRVRVAIIVSCAVLSMWISNTAATAIFLPIVLGLVGPTTSKTDKAAAGTVLGLAYAASLGGMGSLVGTPPNLITARFLQGADMRFGFVEWFAIGFPTAVVTTIAAIFLLRWMLPASATKVDPTAATMPTTVRPGPWKRGEIATAIAFGLAVLGWTVPGVSAALGLPFAEALETYLEPGAVAIFAASILFAVPDGRGERVLRWRDAVSIDWGTIFLFGGGIALGTALITTGLAEKISDGFIAITGIRELWTLTAACCVFTIFFGEIVSNTAAANMLVPLVIAIAVRLELPIAPPALAIGVGASCGFMLPIATAPNALVYGSGRVTQFQMIRTGFVMDVVCAVIVFAMLRLLCPLYGWS